jgi:hypothetical protein
MPWNSPPLYPHMIGAPSPIRDRYSDEGNIPIKENLMKAILIGALVSLSLASNAYATDWKNHPHLKKAHELLEASQEGHDRSQ